MKAYYFESVGTAQSGGGCMVDIFTMKDGRVLVVSDEYVGFYDSVDAFWYDAGDDCRAGFWIPKKEK